MSPPKRRKKLPLPRRKWTRSPVQKAHSSPSGKKGYKREKAKRLEREEIEEK